METHTRRPVLDKRDMTRRWNAGEFGNKIAVWQSLDEFFAAADAGELPADTFTIRNYKPSSPFCCFDVSLEKMSGVVDEFVSRGALFDDMYVNASATDNDKLTLQAEVQRGIGGLDLRYSHVKKKMRDALAEDERNAHGLKATMIVRTLLDPTSQDWLDHLLDSYPNHVVEMSVWSIGMGELGWNTIFWEVRHY